jgi:predicted small lipoprotein YifL
MHIAAPRLRARVALVAAFALAVAASGCGVKGPLVPAPKPEAQSPAQSPTQAPAAPAPPQSSTTPEGNPPERKP